MILLHKRHSLRILDTRTDRDGRYIIIKTKAGTSTIVFSNIYTPNCDHTDLFHVFFADLSAMGHCSLIMAGDFNEVLNPVLDKSVSHSPRNSNIY